MDGWIVVSLMYNPGQFFFFLFLSSITKKMDSGYDALFVCLGKNDTKCFSVFTIVSCRFSLSLDPNTHSLPRPASLLMFRLSVLCVTSLVFCIIVS